MKKIRTIKAGETLAISQGEYSDYSVLGVFEVLQDFNPDDIRKEYLAQNPEQKKPYGFNEEQFLATLAGKGILKDIPYVELHLSDYGNPNEMCVYEPTSQESE